MTLRFVRSIDATYPWLQKWSWVVGFFLLCGFIYERSWSHFHREHQRLHQKKKEIEHSLLVAEEDRQHLQCLLESRDDPAWHELLLREHLGMIAEGETKVYFRR